MTKITRENLVATHKAYEAELKTLEEKEYTYKVDRFCHPYGRVECMSLEDVIGAYTAVHEHDKNVNTAVEALGLDPAKYGVKTSEYLGYPSEEWDADFKTRIEEITDDERIETLKSALAKMRKHFSEDDQFAADMAELAEML